MPEPPNGRQLWALNHNLTLSLNRFLIFQPLITRWEITIKIKTPAPPACFIFKTVFNARAMPTHTSPSQSAEDYLERIHELIEAKGYARVVDIASSLKVRQASVTNMVKKLGQSGYVKYERYRGLILTDQGREVAHRIQRRHETLSRFFSLFGLDAESQLADIEGIEHHLSPATLEMLADLTQYFEANSEALRAFQRSRKRGTGK